jgi:hypothetical protein
VLGVEARRGVLEVDRGVDGDRERAPLAEIAHVDQALDRHLLLRHLLALEPLARLRLELPELALELHGVDAVDGAQEHRR